MSPVATYKEQSPYWEEEGWFKARIKGCQERTIEYTLKESHAAVKSGKKKVGDKDSFVNWEWEIEFISGENSGISMTISTDNSVTFNPEGGELNNTASLIICARGGNPLPVGQSVNTDDYIGMVIDAYVKHQPPRQGASRDGESRTYYNSRVEDWAIAGTHTEGQAAAVDPWAADSQPAQSAPAGFGGAPVDVPPF